MRNLNKWIPCKEYCELGKLDENGKDIREYSKEKNYSSDGYGGFYCEGCLQLKALLNLTRWKSENIEKENKNS